MRRCTGRGNPRNALRSIEELIIQHGYPLASVRFTFAHRLRCAAAMRARSSGASALGSLVFVGAGTRLTVRSVFHVVNDECLSFCTIRWLIVNFTE
jgi:hypothetical protein